VKRLVRPELGSGSNGGAVVAPRVEPATDIRAYLLGFALGWLPLVLTVAVTLARLDLLIMPVLFVGLMAQLMGGAGMAANTRSGFLKTAGTVALVTLFPEFVGLFGLLVMGSRGP
jgi:hypothetical protein